MINDTDIKWARIQNHKVSLVSWWLILCLIPGMSNHGQHRGRLRVVGLFAFFWSLGEWADSALSPRDQKNASLLCIYLKSLRSVQISILEPENYPRSSKIWSVLWKNFGHVGHQIVFQCEIWCNSVAKFVTLSVIDNLWIISVINRVASKNNLTTKPV